MIPFKLPLKGHLGSLFILSLCVCFVGCVHQAPSFTFQIKQTLGGDYQAICLTEEHVLIRSDFQLTHLSMKEGHLKQDYVKHSVNLRAQTSPNSPALQIQYTQRFNELLARCPSTDAWLNIPSVGQLSTTWHDRPLTITRTRWRWGIDSRAHPSHLKDIAQLDPASSQRYLLLGERGIWLWRSGLPQALPEYLPQGLTPPLLNILRDGTFWWISHRSSEGVQAWPILMKERLKKAGPPRSVPEASEERIIPLSGHALKARLGALNFEWSGGRYASAPIRALCVLSNDMVAVGTDRGLTIWRGPNQRATPSDRSKLKLYRELPLPSPISALLCEQERVLILGEGFGLIDMEWRLQNPPS